MAKWMEKLEDSMNAGPGGPKRIRTFRWLLLLALVGAALMVFNSFVHVKQVDPANTGRASPQGGGTIPAGTGQPSAERAAFRDYEQAYETQLRDILSKIVGVGEVEVLVTVESTEEITVEKSIKDTQQVTNEKDQNGATRHVTDVTRSTDPVTTKSSEGGDTPLVTKTVKPKIRGVMVVARGAEHATVRKLILDSVERGLDVPSYRISVVPRKQ